MRFNPFRTHPLLAHISIAWLVLAALLSYQLGELKYSGDIAWLDILGEGGIVLMILTGLSHCWCLGHRVKSQPCWC